MRFIHALLLAILLSATSCSGLLIHQALEQKDLTPEQIEAYRKVGSKVHSCLQIAGPPPAGSSSIVLLPQSSNQIVKFGPQCQVMMQ